MIPATRLFRQDLQGKEKNCLIDPDCVRCLRKTLDALGVVVFFREGTSWRIGNFQGEIPRDAAEVQFQAMLQCGVPETLAGQQDGLLITDESALREVFPKLCEFLAEKTVIGSSVQYKDLHGVRLAWRDGTRPFTTADLLTLRCFGECPEECRE